MLVRLLCVCVCVCVCVCLCVCERKWVFWLFFHLELYCSIKFRIWLSTYCMLSTMLSSVWFIAVNKRKIPFPVPVNTSLSFFFSKFLSGSQAYKSLSFLWPSLLLRLLEFCHFFPLLICCNESSLYDLILWYSLSIIFTVFLGMIPGGSILDTKYEFFKNSLYVCQTAFQKDCTHFHSPWKYRSHISILTALKDFILFIYLFYFAF